MFTALIFSGCNHWRGIRGSGDISEEYRDIEEFSKLEVSGAFTVNLLVGDDPSLKISADDNLLKHIKTTVRGDRLIIETRKNINASEAIVIDVSTPFLNRVDASGANKVKVKGIDSDNFSVDISGANTVELEGRTDKFYADMSGATKLYAGELKAERVKVDCSGASKAEVYASESLDADASGASKISFTGDARDVRTDVSGVGRVSRK
jgi:hypothetical protein